VEDREYVLEPDGVIPALRALVRRFDPHIILSEWGDSFLLRRLSLLARRFGEPLPFDRGNTRTRPEQRGRSYFSYGRIVYFAPSQFLSGRWHLDTRNSFVCAESGLNGLFELARLSKIPVQRLARLSTGTCISSMQLDVAIRQGYLIPWQKKVPEEFKDAEELLVTDKGGLTYQPVIGFHEQVAELDFASMYPTLMARYNLSPETVNCTCCPDVPPVPEAGYRICQKRKGLIATTLEPILRRRRIYKERRRDAGTPEERALYDRRQNALKWILVTCFGFLGYRNARFGKIEAHESTTAWGREKMLVAKELAESLGFAFLHGLTDSLWVRKEGATEEDYHRLADAASEATGLTVSLEGIYDWIAFLPSRQDPRVAVPSRYFGLFRGGDLKIRGLDLRRHDTPPWIKMVQGELLEIVRHAHTRREYAERIPLVLERLQVHIADLRASRVDPLQLAITRRLTQEPLSYRKPSYAAIAAQEMTARGIALHPGEKIQFLLTATRSPLPSDRAKAIGFLDGTEAYDIPKYEELLLRAAEPLFIHFGWDCARLRGHFSAAFCHSERSAAK
jgi:DNA polymerase elongation subunit (family B)